MMNRTALAGLLLLAAGFARAENVALGQVKTMSGGQAGLGAYDGGCSGGSCGIEPQDEVCTGETCRINRASAGALKKGGLVVPVSEERPVMKAEVPAPKLGADKEGSKDKPGFFSNLFNGKSLMYGLGGGAAGAGIGFLLGGPIGALIGGLLGAIGGLFLAKKLA